MVMKKLIAVLVIGATVVPARAQLFSGNALGWATLGGLIGGIVGHNSGRHTAEGVGIGAGAGLLLGALADNSRPAWYGEAQPVAPFAPSYAPAAPNYALSGAVLGGIAGGVIGHNSGRHTGEGIAIGAASGLFLGAVADESARRRFQAQGVPVKTGYAAQTAAAPAVQMANTTVNSATAGNAYYTAPQSAMAGANSLFGR